MLNYLKIMLVLKNLSNKIGGSRTIRKKSLNPALKSLRTTEKPAYFKNIPARTP